MIVAMHATKLIVSDLDATERFYTAIGLKIANRNEGGEGPVQQAQCWLSATGTMDAHLLILSHFLAFPACPKPVYPGEVWLAFNVSDVDAVVAAAHAAGGEVVRAGEDRPEHGVRAAVVSDNEGHFIELVGPMNEG